MKAQLDLFPKEAWGFEKSETGDYIAIKIEKHGNKWLKPLDYSEYKHEPFYTFEAVDKALKGWNKLNDLLQRPINFFKK